MKQPNQDDIELPTHQWQRERRTREILSSLSYRADELSHYLKDLACGVSQQHCPQCLRGDRTWGCS
ncbi:MAG TPA: hypothetical protein V6D26_22470 [Stenomitos sp.]